jgi:ABC-type nitrate/sulfonate/bicarbonate transport system substrate-binding protein
MLALVMALVACGPAPAPAPAKPAPAAASGAPVAAAPQTSAAPAAPGTAPTTLDKVSYGIVSYNPFHWVAMVAQEKKLMEPYGIDLDLTITRTVPAAMTALASGSLDLATTSPGGAWDVQQKVPGFKQVLEIVSKNPYSVVVQPEITSYADLRGTTVAGQSLTSGADIEVLRLLLEEHGLQYPRDYDILAIGSVAERQAALLANQVSAAAMIPPNSYELLDHGKQSLDDAWRHPFLRDVTTVTALARESWYKEKPDVARRFVQGYVAGTAWVYDPRNRDEAIRILAEQTRMDPKYAERTYQQFVVEMQLLPANPRVDPTRLAQSYANLKRVGLVVPDDPPSLADNSLVDRALQ